jgi:hypothetical protein
MSTNRTFTDDDWNRLDPDARRALIREGFTRKYIVGRWGEKIIKAAQRINDDTLIEGIRDAMRS